jgi:hypothetical protein
MVKVARGKTHVTDTLSFRSPPDSPAVSGNEWRWHYYIYHAIMIKSKVDRSSTRTRGIPSAHSRVVILGRRGRDGPLDVKQHRTPQQANKLNRLSAADSVLNGTTSRS